MRKWTEEELAAFRARQSAKRMPKAESRAKYRNKKTTIDGKTFDSKAEALRYVELKRLEMAKLISALRCQEPFSLVVNGALICKYIADFVYQDAAGRRVVEDVKGVRTRDYVIKAKLMKACHGITILETGKRATARPSIARKPRKDEQ